MRNDSRFSRYWFLDIIVRFWENLLDFHLGYPLHARLVSLGFNSYSVLGWSNGGTVGMILSGKYHEMVEKLVVWGSYAFVTQEDADLFKDIRELEKWSERMKAPLEGISIFVKFGIFKK